MNFFTTNSNLHFFWGGGGRGEGARVSEIVFLRIQI